ncbi:MAG TPA: HlyD family secretion protein [Candidatus Saccharimonadales bacterium]|jgi:membrane fusion protein (multidrug efflux system)|nr:HlyD family secretion protein [Candidatus Saccharimonadales bacterium]
MSVEIEVGLENAARVKAAPAQEFLLDEEPPKGLKNPKVRGLLVVGGLVLLAVLISLLVYYHNRETTDDAQVDGHITPIASKIYGRVAEVLVTDNQPVKAGQVLVKIDPRDYQASLDQAKAALALAESDAASAGVDVPRTRENVASGTSSADAQLSGAGADLERAQVTYDQARTSDLAYAQANIEKSKANAELAQADLARYKPLLDKGEISKQQYDAAKANADATASGLRADQERLAQAQRAVDIAKAQLLAARARVEQAKAGVSAAHADTRQISMRTSDAQGKVAKVQQARAALEAAELNVGYTEIVAPVDGVATHKQVEPGQIVQQGQGLLVVVPLQDVWVTANFKETQLRKMRAGQKAYVHVDTYGQTFPGHLDSIAGATGAVLSLLPPENATGNYVKVVQRIPVKIVLDPIAPDKAILRPGMNVDATIITQ